MTPLLGDFRKQELKDILPMSLRSMTRTPVGALYAFGVLIATPQVFCRVHGERRL